MANYHCIWYPSHVFRAPTAAFAIVPDLAKVESSSDVAAAAAVATAAAAAIDAD